MILRVPSNKSRATILQEDNQRRLRTDKPCAPPCRTHVIVVAHVHPAVQHHVLPRDGHQDAAAPHVLPGACSESRGRHNAAAPQRSARIHGGGPKAALTERRHLDFGHFNPPSKLKARPGSSGNGLRGGAARRRAFFYCHIARAAQIEGDLAPIWIESVPKAALKTPRPSAAGGRRSVGAAPLPPFSSTSRARAVPPARQDGGGAGRLQPSGGAGRLPGVRDGAARGAAWPVPPRLAGTRAVSAGPGGEDVANVRQMTKRANGILGCVRKSAGSRSGERRSSRCTRQW